MGKLTKEQILNLPKELETKTIREVATLYGVHYRTIDYWIRRHRDEGNIIPIRRNGRKPLKLNE